MSACSPRRVAIRVFFGLSMIFLLVGWVSTVQACRIDSSSSARVFYRHVVGACSFEEREGLAITAKEILEALRAGKSLDLLGVVVTGDLLLDQLLLVPMEQQAFSSERVQDMLKQRRIKDVRTILGSISFRDSWFQGLLATNLTSGALVIVGDVNVAGTQFQKSVDFSKTVFLNSVDFSNAVILFEGFFISAHFDQDVNFENTAFGVHTRFHKSFFGGTATFHRARFDGLAEFLEVVFEKNTSFSQTYFKMGTGFSGARFKGPLDFSEAVFEREAYLRFTEFEQECFLSKNNLSRRDRFHQCANFRAPLTSPSVLFEKPPDFSGTDIDRPNAACGEHFRISGFRWGFFWPS